MTIPQLERRTVHRFVGIPYAEKVAYSCLLGVITFLSRMSLQQLFGEKYFLKSFKVKKNLLHLFLFCFSSLMDFNGSV